MPLMATVQIQAANSDCWQAKHFSAGVKMKKNQDNLFKATPGSPNCALIDVTAGLLK